MSPAHEQVVRQTICDKRPEPLKLDFALWLRPAVRQHVELSMGIQAFDSHGLELPGTLGLHAEGAEIHWRDAPVRKTPVTFAVGGTRHKLSIIANAITSKVPVRTKAKLRQAATEHMTMLGANARAGEKVCR